MDFSDKEFIRQLFEYEKRVPVQNVRLHDFHVWPLFRWMIIDRSRPHLNADKIGDEKHTSVGTIFRLFLSKCSQLFCNPRSFLYLASDLFKIQKTSVDFLSCSLVGGKLQQVDGKTFSKFSDALSAIVGGESKLLDLDLFLLWKLPYARRGEPSLLLDLLLAKAWCLSKVHFGRRKYQQWLLEAAVLKNGMAEFPSLSCPDVKAVWKRACFIAALQKELVVLLGRLQPKAVIIGDYYNDLGMALAAACRECSIPSVELQHGKQGAFHYMYSHWSKVPREGYDLVPSHFWTWGEASRKVIAEWTDTTEGHDVFVGGNPWLAYQREHVAGGGGLSLALTRRLKEADMSILVALQPIDGCFTKPVEEAMQGAPDVLWILRPHPSMLKDVPLIRRRLETLEVANFLLEEALDADLYSLFHYVDVNITYWSSVAYEALSFGVPTIIAHPNGQEIMADYIERKHFGYAATGAELLDLLKEKPFVPEEAGREYIQADPDLVRKSLCQFLVKQG